MFLSITVVIFCLNLWGSVLAICAICNLNFMVMCLSVGFVCDLLGNLLSEEVLCYMVYFISDDVQWYMVCYACHDLFPSAGCLK